MGFLDKIKSKLIAIIDSPITTFIGTTLITFGCLQFSREPVQAVAIIMAGVGLLASKDA